MLPIHKIVWHEWRERDMPVRVPEPEAMTDPQQIRSYVQAYEWGGPTSALQLYHLQSLSRMIRPGDTVVDLACGPGPLLLELARLYPTCRFIGADLSEPMLSALREQAAREGLSHIETRREDIRFLPSMPAASVDLVISTSALHHLPDLDSLRMTFECAKRIMKSDARAYFFDFGLLKSPKTRQLMVSEVAKLAPPVTAKDYELSLNAAFSISDVAHHSETVFGPSLQAHASSFVDFFYFLKTADGHANPDPAVAARLREIQRQLTSSMALEHLMLRLLQRRLH